MYTQLPGQNIQLVAWTHVRMLHETQSVHQWPTCVTCVSLPLWADNGIPLRLSVGQHLVPLWFDLVSPPHRNAIQLVSSLTQTASSAGFLACVVGRVGILCDINVPASLPYTHAIHKYGDLRPL